MKETTNIFLVTWQDGHTEKIEASEFDMLGIFIVFYVPISNDKVMAIALFNGNDIRSVVLER